MYLLCKKIIKINKCTNKTENLMTGVDHEIILWIFFLCVYLFYKNEISLYSFVASYSPLTIQLKSVPCHNYLPITSYEYLPIINVMAMS